MGKLPYYSYSKIKSFHECPWGFYLKYYENMPNPQSHGVSEFGTFCHALLEQYEKKELKKEELSEVYIRDFDKNTPSTFVIDFGGFKKNLYSNYYSSGLEYFENFKGYDLSKIIEVEYDFKIPIENIFILIGKIDLIFRDENDNLCILDHKSKKKFKNKAELKEYSKQLYLYAYAVYLKYNEYPKYLFFNRFRDNEEDVIEFKEDEMHEVIEWAIDSVIDIENSIEFNPNYGTFYCKNFCSYRGKCGVDINGNLG